MNIIDYNNLSPVELIGQYVVELRSSGHCLPYDDYLVIEKWLSILPDTDKLLLVLNEILPEHFDKPKGTHPPSLKRANQKVVKKLKELSSRATLSLLE